MILIPILSLMYYHKQHVILMLTCGGMILQVVQMTLAWYIGIGYLFFIRECVNEWNWYTDSHDS